MQDLWRLVVAPNPVLDDVVREQLLVQSGQASRMSSLLSVPLSAVVLVVAVASGAVMSQVLTWVATVLLVMVVYVVGVGRFVVGRRHSYRARLRTYLAFQLLGGLAWGLISVLVAPVPGDATVVSLACSVTLLTVAANVIFSCGTPVAWAVFHTSALTAGALGLTVHGEGAVAALDGLVLLGAVPLARYMYQQVARAQLTARRNQLLVADLRLERQSVERINLELSEANAELRQQATRDPLTRLPNRTLFFEHLDRSARHGRRHGTPVSVIFFDLDRFKAVNDTLGHGAGDDLLCQVADRVTATLRSPDVLARLGGDEFVVISHDDHHDDDHDDDHGDGHRDDDRNRNRTAVRVAERIRQVLAVPFDLSGNPVVISSSLGVAADEPGLSGDDLVQRADLALYRAKQRGRNQVATFDPSMLEA